MDNPKPSSKRSTAFQVFAKAPPKQLPPTVAIVGPDRFLKQRVREHLLTKVDSGDELERLDGSECGWQDVLDEMCTVSLFSTGPRKLLVTQADDLIKAFRGEIEDYVATATRGLLIFELESLPANTNVAKLMEQRGLVVECKVPEIKPTNDARFGSTPEQRWLLDWAKQRHGIGLESRAAALLVDLIGWEFGMLDQELAKLALFLARDAEATLELVQDVVGGWRTETNWEMLDAVADGDAERALAHFDRLLQSGESPQALFGSIAWSLRRYAAATRIFQDRERQGKRPKLHDALLEAGFRRWPPEALDRAAMQLKQMTRQRSGQLFRWLLETDLALKGSHASPHRARQIIEQLFLRLARQANPRATSGPRSVTQSNVSSNHDVRHA